MSVRLKVAGLCALALLAGWTPAAAQSSMGEQIRREGLANSHAMTLVTQLADGIGPRLMGSPNLRAAYDWAQKTFKDLGAENVHLEDMGEFGLSWRQNNAWLRMSAPDPVVFVAQAAPWSVSSHGPQTGEAVAVELNSDADFAKYEGRLRGKVVLLGPAIDLPPANAPFNERATKDDVLSGRIIAMQRGYHQRRATAPPPPTRDFGAEKAAFLAREGALAVVLPSPQMPTRSGTTGLLVVDKPPFGVKPWTAETRPKFPMLVAAVESFGRAWRLSMAGAPVRMQFDVDAETLGEHEHGFNVVAEIPGSDPKLKSEVVILGAHLDSWAAGQGATDNGTGVAATIEALRILKDRRRQAEADHPLRPLRGRGAGPAGVAGLCGEALRVFGLGPGPVGSAAAARRPEDPGRTTARSPPSTISTTARERSWRSSRAAIRRWRRSTKAGCRTWPTSASSRCSTSGPSSRTRGRTRASGYRGSASSRNASTTSPAPTIRRWTPSSTSYRPTSRKARRWRRSSS
jgi:hypothetical protein